MRVNLKHYIRVSGLKKLKYVSVLFFVVLLTACTTIQAPVPYVNWQTRYNQLSKIQNWQIKGVIAIKTLQKSLSASLYWQQACPNYTLHLFGPLGMGAVNIKGTPHRITLQKNHQTYVAKNPEQLLQQQLGWYLPISSLHYWIRGIPVPNIKAIKRFDRYNRLIYLKQQGWEIQYLNYTRKAGLSLPAKILLDSETLQVKITLTQWKMDS